MDKRSQMGGVRARNGSLPQGSVASALSKTSTAPVHPNGGTQRWVLVACCMSVLLVSLDVTIVNVALPSIQHGLNATVNGLQWTIDAYTLVMAALLLIAGSVADRFGPRKVFLVGLAVFTLGSALCAVAPSLAFLIAARVIQALGGAMLNPVALSILRNTFQDPRERANAIGIWAGVTGISIALGPVVGGLLVDGPGWRYIFLVNAPIGIAAIILVLRVVPEARIEYPRRFDVAGQVLVIVLLMALIYAVIEGTRLGWFSPVIIGCFVITAAAGITLVRYEQRRIEPLLDMRFFRSIPFSVAAVIAACVMAGTAGSLFLTTLYLQTARGYSALEAGLYSLPTAVATFFLSPVAGRVTGKYGSRWLFIAAGLARIAPGLLLIRLTLHTSPVLIVIALALNGAGMGLANPPISATAMAGMPAEQAGVAGGITAAANQIGASLGVAIVGATLGVNAVGLAGPAFAQATHAGWAVLAGIGAIILALGIVTTSQWARNTAKNAVTEIVAQ